PLGRGHFNRAVRRRRRIGGDSADLEHSLQTKKMESIADHKGCFPSLRMQQTRYRLNAVRSTAASLLRNNHRGINAMLFQILCRDASLEEIGIRAVASGSNDCWRVAFLKEFQRVIQTRFEHRRRASIVLSSA